MRLLAYHIQATFKKIPVTRSNFGFQFLPMKNVIAPETPVERPRHFV